MTATTTRDDAADPAEYVVIHNAIRGVGAALAVAVESVSRADQPRLRAFVRDWRGHRGEILAHHGIEDDIFFPALRERVPSVADVLDRLDDDHHHLDELMTACDEAIEQIVAGAEPRTAAGALRRLAEVMTEHLAVEDRDVVPMFAAHFSAAEYAALTKLAIKRTGLGRQAAFTVPYIASWATPEARDELLGTAGVPFQVLYRLTRRRHGRLAALALGPVGP